MTRQFDRAKTLIRAIVHEVQTERIMFMAGTIAYNAFLSLLPLLFLLLAIVSAVGGTALEDSMIGLTWLYLCGLVILSGAAINAVLSNRSEDINVEPVLGGVPKETTSTPNIDDQHVPEAALRRLQHSLGDATTVTVRLDDGVEVDLPAPDIVSVDADTSAMPVINDTATLELRWAEASAASPSHE